MAIAVALDRLPSLIVYFVEAGKLVSLLLSQLVTVHVDVNIHINGLTDLPCILRSYQGYVQSLF